MTFHDPIPETGYAEPRGVSIRSVHGTGSPKIFEGPIVSGALVPSQGAPEHDLACCVRSEVDYALLCGICGAAHWAEYCAIPMAAGQGGSNDKTISA